MPLKHFKTEADVLAYIQTELLATLCDDLDRMEGREENYYSDEDRDEMRDKVEDVESVLDRVAIAPAPTLPLSPAEFNAVLAGLRILQKALPGGYIPQWDAREIIETIHADDETRAPLSADEIDGLVEKLFGCRLS